MVLLKELTLNSHIVYSIGVAYDNAELLAPMLQTIVTLTDLKIKYNNIEE